MLLSKCCREYVLVIDGQESSSFYACKKCGRMTEPTWVLADALAKCPKDSYDLKWNRDKENTNDGSF